MRFLLLRSCVLPAFAAVALALCPLAEARTFFLAPDGRDTASRSGSANQPWKTPQYAAGRMANGDDLTLQAGTYYLSTPQTFDRSGSGSNKTVIQAAPGARVIFDGSRITQDWKNLLLIDGDHVVVRRLEFRRYDIGGGCVLRGDNGVIDDCKAYELGGWGLQIGGGNTFPGPRNCTIQYSSVYNCVLMNKQGAPHYQGWKDNGGGWPGAMGVGHATNARVLNNWVGGNHGEGIILSRVRGGQTLVQGNYARDNYSVNIYLDGVSGDNSSYARVKDNTCETQFKSEFYRSGSPAHNFMVSSENYDNLNQANNDTQKLSLTGNTARNGGHNFLIYGSGKPIHDVWIDGNTAQGSSWGNYKRTGQSYIYNIWLGRNSGF